jgi:putative solute:sodium symporter small subunit
MELPTNHAQGRTSAPGVATSRAAPWRATRQLTLVLLFVWALVTLGVILLARDASGVVFGWPLGFWMAAQGAPLAYWLIVVFYARRTTQIERDAGLDED